MQVCVLPNIRSCLSLTLCSAAVCSWLLAVQQCLIQRSNNLLGLHFLRKGQIGAELAGHKHQCQYQISICRTKAVHKVPAASPPSTPNARKTQGGINHWYQAAFPSPRWVIELLSFSSPSGSLATSNLCQLYLALVPPPSFISGWQPGGNQSPRIPLFALQSSSPSTFCSYPFYTHLLVHPSAFNPANSSYILLLKYIHRCPLPVQGRQCGSS